MGLFAAIFWTVLAVVALPVVIVRRRMMLALLWPVFVTYPYHFMRSRTPSFIIGFHDVFLALCGLLIILVDFKKLREGYSGLGRTGRLFMLTWGALVLMEVVARTLFVIRYPVESPLLIFNSFMDESLRLVPALMVVAYVRNVKDARLAMYSFLVSIAFAFVLVYLDKYSPAVYDIFHRAAFGTSWLDHFRRPVGIFSGPWEVGVVGAVVIAFVGGVIGTRTGVGWPFGLSMMVLTGVGVALSQSRGGILSMAVALVPYLVFGRSVFKVRWLAMIAVVVAAFSYLTVVSSDGLSIADLVINRMSRAVSNTGFQGTAETRILIWKDLWDLITTNRLSWDRLGFGVGGMAGAVREFGKTAHSGFLGPFVYFGIVGGAILTVSYVAMVVSALKDAVSARRVAVLAVVVTSMINMIGNEFLTGERYLGFCIMLLSMTGLRAATATGSTGPNRITGNRAARPAVPGPVCNPDSGPAPISRP